MTLMNTFDATEATPVSPYVSDFVPFQIIANSIHDVFNNAILTPGVMVRIIPVLAFMFNFFFSISTQVINIFRAAARFSNPGGLAAMRWA